MHHTHCISKALVPRRTIRGSLLRIAMLKCFDKGLLNWSTGRHLSYGRTCSIVAAPNCIGQVFVIKERPWLIVVWPQAICQTPVGHCAVRVGNGGLLEAKDRFLMIKCIRPYESTVEPCLAFGGGSRDSSLIQAKIKRVYG